MHTPYFLGLHQLVHQFWHRCMSPKDIYHLKYHPRCAYQHLFKILDLLHLFRVYGSQNQMREVVRYDLSYSFTDTIFGNCSNTPSLQNSKINPLIINVENQRHNCKSIIIMFILYGRMSILYLASAHFLCLVCKVLNRK